MCYHLTCVRFDILHKCLEFKCTYNKRHDESVTWYIVCHGSSLKIRCSHWSVFVKMTLRTRQSVYKYLSIGGDIIPE